MRKCHKSVRSLEAWEREDIVTAELEAFRLQAGSKSCKGPGSFSVQRRVVRFSLTDWDCEFSVLQSLRRSSPNYQ